MIENESQRIWNFTLEPGQMTSMHRHDFDYSFVAIKPSQLEVFGEDRKNGIQPFVLLDGHQSRFSEEVLAYITNDSTC